MSPNENNILEFYLYLAETYRSALKDVETMRFDLQVIATPERLELINQYRADFQESLEELTSIDEQLDNLIARNESDNLLVSAFLACKEASGFLQGLSKYIIVGVNNTEANLIFYENQINGSH